MAPRDVIVSAFARSDRVITAADGTEIDLGSFSQPLDAFAEQPAFIDVPFAIKSGEGHYDKAFRRSAAKYERAGGGSILQGLFAEHLSGMEVRRVCLIGFSAGGSFVDAVMSGPDAEIIDTVIMLDALHLMKSWEGAPNFIDEQIGPWVNFGVRCARAVEEVDGPMCVFAHTEIATPSPLVGSTSASIAEVSRQVLNNAPGAVRTGYNPDLLLGGPPPPAVSLGPSTGLPEPEVTFERVPAPTGPMRGNYLAMNFGGRVAASHAFIPWFVQPGLWRALLAPRWNAGLDCEPPAVSGLGGMGQRFCGPQGIVVPEGTYEIPAVSRWVWGAAGFAMGAAAGVMAGKSV